MDSRLTVDFRAVRCMPSLSIVKGDQYRLTTGPLRRKIIMDRCDDDKDFTVLSTSWSSPIVGTFYKGLGVRSRGDVTLRG